jgi:uncharacterized cupredoxin-like copper-binding protein
MQEGVNMKKIVGSITLILSILLTACGAAGANGPSTTLNVDMNEFMFTPTSYTIPAGQKITLELKNSGSIDHDFIILKKGVKVKGSFDHEKQMDDIYFHAMLKAGKSGEFTFTAPAEAGEYQIICGVLGHFQAGMIASLIVQ